MTFQEIGISINTINGLKDMNINNPTVVQEKAIPLILKGQNIIVQSKTGTGKTLAYVIPIIESMKFIKNECLIIAPTRELTKQIYQVIKDLEIERINIMTIYGGVSINNQIKELEQEPHIIVGTPGRLIDLYKRKKLKFNNIRFVVLDEADRLLDMGFFPDIKYLLKAIKTKFQFMLFSATIEENIRKLAKRFTKNKFIYINLSKDNLTVSNTKQFFYMIDFFNQKYHIFLEILKKERPKFSLVFVNTKKTGKWLFKKLKNSFFKRFYKIGLISGELSQHKREIVLKNFRKNKINMLIATDVAARGLDIENISHVFNYDIPKFPENYIHRIGRTSRMNKDGIAISLVLKEEYEYLCHIEGLINKEIKQKFLPFQEERRKRFPFY